MNEFKLIGTAGEWTAIIEKLSHESVVAFDTESNSFYRYPEQLCLLQLATPREVILVDTLAIPNLSEFSTVTTRDDIEKIVHDADYDLRCLDRECGMRFKRIFDTALATRFLNPMGLSLASALQKYLNITVEKHKKLQRANWGLRPLSPDLLTYASKDAEHLIPLAEKLKEELRALGRLTWVEEECRVVEGIRHNPPLPPEEAVFNMKGTSRLPEDVLARLQALFVYRDQEARKRHRPPFMVVANEMLVKLAEHPHLTKKYFPAFTFPPLHPVTHPSKKPGPKNPWTNSASKRMDALREARKKVGETLGIGPYLLWPEDSLQYMALHPHDGLAEFSGESQFRVRAWQREIMGDLLKKTLSQQ